MYLDSIEIKRYRSIENTKLTSCGEFNVLIGKNNSGKSDIVFKLCACRLKASRQMECLPTG